MKSIKSEPNKEKILKEIILQPNQNIKKLLNTILLLGSLGFLIVSISSYYNQNIIGILDASKIIFFPQGLVMFIYGFLGLLISINQILILYWGVGEGFNEFNKQTGNFKLFRKNSYYKSIELIYSINDIVRDINLKTKL